MLIRFLLIGLAVVVAIYLYRRLAPRMARDPRTRSWVQGVGMNVMFLYLLRRAFPFLLRALRSIRLFR